MKRIDLDTPRTPREVIFEHALILRRLSGQIRMALIEPETIPMPASLRRSLSGSAKAFEDCAADLEALATTASHTVVRVPTWRDGTKVAVGFIVPSAAVFALFAIIATVVPERPIDPQQILRAAEERKWMSMAEERLNHEENSR